MFLFSFRLLLTDKISESRAQNKTKNSFFVFYAETHPNLSKISETRAQNKIINISVSDKAPLGAVRAEAGVERSGTPVNRHYK